MVMSPNLAPPAPPPLQPVTSSSNPYAFITQSPTTGIPSKPPGGSKKKRIIIVGAGVVLLLIIGGIVMSILSSASDGPKTDYKELVHQQVELIRVSDLGLKQARSPEARNLAVTTKYSLLSEQPELLKLAKKAGVLTDAKSLTLGQDTQIDSSLKTASQTNQFDEVFIKIMQSNLKKYQAALKKVHDESTSKSTKAILDKDFTNAGILIGE